MRKIIILLFTIFAFSGLAFSWTDVTGSTVGSSGEAVGGQEIKDIQNDVHDIPHSAWNVYNVSSGPYSNQNWIYHEGEWKPWEASNIDLEDVVTSTPAISVRSFPYDFDGTNWDKAQINNWLYGVSRSTGIEKLRQELYGVSRSTDVEKLRQELYGIARSTDAEKLRQELYGVSRSSDIEKLRQELYGVARSTDMDYIIHLASSIVYGQYGIARSTDIEKLRQELYGVARSTDAEKIRQELYGVMRSTDAEKLRQELWGVARSSDIALLTSITDNKDVVVTSGVVKEFQVPTATGTVLDVGTGAVTTWTFPAGAVEIFLESDETNTDITRWRYWNEDVKVAGNKLHVGDVLILNKYNGTTLFFQTEAGDQKIIVQVLYE